MEKDGEFYYYDYDNYIKHELDLVDEKYRHIVKVLLSWEDSLTDGYKYYCEHVASEQAEKYYGGNYILGALVEIAKEILGEKNEDGNYN